MKKLFLALAAVVLLTTATVPSFADGNPYPHGAQCRSLICRPPA